MRPFGEFTEGFFFHPHLAENNSRENTWKLRGATADNPPDLSLIPRWPLMHRKEIYSPSSFWQDVVSQSCASGLSVSWFRNRAASLIHDSCYHWWVCILCWLSACNIDTAWTTTSPPLYCSSPPSTSHHSLLPLLFPPSVCVFLSLHKHYDDSALFGRALTVMSLPLVFPQPFTIHVWI